MSASLLAIAKGYPYEAPTESFVYRDGVEQPLALTEDGGLPIDSWRNDGRVPVLAYGANRSASALARKFADWPEGTAIPVTRAQLRDHDIVYSSHLSRYGSAPAKIDRVDGVTVEISVVWLTGPQLTRMHETEGAQNYRFDRLDGLELALDDGEAVLTSVFAYIGKRPSLNHDGAPIPLAKIQAKDRRHPPLDQTGVLKLIRNRLAPGAPLDAFILQSIACPVTRQQRTDRLGQLGGNLTGDPAA
ncbi:MAG: hypothetical protein AAF414_03025 [Pseudomonadota bacterium]